MLNQNLHVSHLSVSQRDISWARPQDCGLNPRVLLE